LELQEIAQGISLFSKELSVATVVLAQIKRPRDKKPDSEPDMSEFRECGDIEQEAHLVGLLHRPHYYVKHNLEKQEALAADLQERFQKEARWKGVPEDQVTKITFGIEDLARYAKLIIDKQREGPVGPIDLRFIADYTKFETWDTSRARYSNDPTHRQAPPADDTHHP
jgi:replicative DNA helicase